MSARLRLVSALDRWAVFLPERIAEEDLGGFIELLNRNPRGGARVYMLAATAVLFTGCNAIREAPFLVNQRVLRRIVMWIAALNVLFALSLSREPLAHVGRDPGSMLMVQCLVGLLLSAAWIGSGMAVWRRWRSSHQLAVGVAVATVLYTVWLSNVMGTFGLVTYTVYPLAVLVVFAWAPRPSSG